MIKRMQQTAIRSKYKWCTLLSSRSAGRKEERTPSWSSPARKIAPSGCFRSFTSFVDSRAAPDLWRWHITLPFRCFSEQATSCKMANALVAILALSAGFASAQVFTLSNSILEVQLNGECHSLFFRSGSHLTMVVLKLGCRNFTID